MSTDTPIDGRRRRRELGREAVIEALLDLLLEGRTEPDTGLLAERSGVSVASVFRYFDSLDDLRAQAIERYFTRFAHLFDVPDIGTGTREERIRKFVSARVHQHRTTDPVARNVRSEARSVAVTGEALERLRATQIDQIRIHFADELAACSRAERDDLVTTLATLTSYESWEQSRGTSARSDAQIRRAWTAALTALLP